MKRLVFVLCVWTSAAYGWNATGHKAIALIAYDHLTRPRSNTSIKSWPGIRIIRSGSPAAYPPPIRGRAAFLRRLWPLAG